MGKLKLPETVKVTPIVLDDRHLEVSTIRVGRADYATCIFDRSKDRRHTGKWLDGNKIAHTNVRDVSRESAMDTHRAAVELCKTEDIT
jgi:hypothetical protein